MRTYIQEVRIARKDGIFMEVISLHVDTISRRKGRSSVQMAAYCSRSKMLDDYTGETYDYTKRSDLVYHRIMLPDHAPENFCNSEVLWNSVEKIEKARNARLARVITIALPKELAPEIHIAMVQRYVQEYFVQRGMCADVSIHDKGDGNPHAHVLLTTRSLDSAGRWMDKQHRNYLLDENGERIFDPIKSRYKLGRSVKTHDWDDPGRVQEWRAGWADACNAKFRQHGIDKEVTCLSYAKQGIDREPTKHLGAKARAMESRGILTGRGNDNRRIIAERQRQDRRRFRQRMKQNRTQCMERELEQELDIELSR